MPMLAALIKSSASETHLIPLAHLPAAVGSLSSDPASNSTLLLILSSEDEANWLSGALLAGPL